VRLKTENFVVLTISVLAFTALNISLTLNVGALAAIPDYDDNGYLLDGYYHFMFDCARSLWSLAVNFNQHPSYVPVETLTIILGYWLFGSSNVGSYIMKIWSLAAYALVIFSVAPNRVDSRSATLLAIAAMFVPAAGAATAPVFLALVAYISGAIRHMPTSIRLRSQTATFGLRSEAVGSN